MWDSKNPDIGAAMFIFEDGRLESKEEALELNSDDHFVLTTEFDLLRTGMTMADVEAIIGGTYGSSVGGFETNEEGKEVMIETTEYLTKKDGEKVVLVFRDNKLVSKEWLSAKSAVSH